MRVAAVIILALMLAGCGDPPSRPTTDPADFFPVPERFDDLTARLDAGSTEFQDFLVEEDNVTLPGGGWVAFQTGRGMHCAGDADAVAPNATGWVACMVRLVREPTAMSQDVRDLGIGYDGQRLTLRLPGEPVEWRLVVWVAEGEGAVAMHDTGWRRVDLSPRLVESSWTAAVRDPCDRLDAAESDRLGGPRGDANVTLLFTVAHGQVNVTMDFAGSMPTDAEPGAELSQEFFVNGYEGGYGPTGPAQSFRTVVFVDLEAAEPPPQSASSGCAATLGSEAQHWTAVLTMRGADGKATTHEMSADVTVLLDGAPAAP